MSIIDQLSSQVGSRNQAANETVAVRCLAEPERLDEIAEGLQSNNAPLLGDCAEVMTMVAQRRPEFVSPYVDLLIALLPHRTTRVRWEAMHAIALVAHLVPAHVLGLLPQLGQILRTDKSIIVRDYAVDALGNAAKADASTAQQIYPLLQEALHLWESRHAGRVLTGLCHVVANVSALAVELEPVVQMFANHSKGTVRKAAKALAKAVARV